MPKYICDTDIVRKDGKKLVNCAEREAKVLNTLSRRGKELLSSYEWTGDAKDSFAVTYEKVGNYACENAYHLQNLGLYLQFVADTIDETEEMLAKKDF